MEQAPLTIGQLRKATDRLNQYVSRGIQANIRPTLGCIALFDHPRGTVIEATDSYAACRLSLPVKIPGLRPQVCEHGSDVPVALVELAELRKRLKEAGSARCIVTLEWIPSANVMGTHLSLQGAEQGTKVYAADVSAWPSLWEFFERAREQNTESCRYEGDKLSAKKDRPEDVDAVPSGATRQRLWLLRSVVTDTGNIGTEKVYGHWYDGRRLEATARAFRGETVDYYPPSKESRSAGLFVSPTMEAILMPVAAPHGAT